MTATPTAPKKTSPLLIALAVTVVAVPLAWGVSQTVMKSTPLFHAAKSTTTKPAKAAKGAKVAPTTGPTSSPTTDHATAPGKRKKKK